MGAVIGGLIGHGLDQAQEAQLRAQAPQTMQRVEQGQPLTPMDVQALAKAGISDELIISQIRNSRTVYHLTAADIITLKNAGVSERIIDFMINTPTQIGAAQAEGVVGPTPPPPPPETIVVAPGPDYVWVGGPLDLAPRLLASADASASMAIVMTPRFQRLGRYSFRQHFFTSCSRLE